MACGAMIGGGDGKGLLDGSGRCDGPGAVSTLWRGGRRRAAAVRWQVPGGGGERTVAEGSSRARNVVVEFPSYQDALDCWHSPEYQAARELRLAAASMDLVIVEGCDEVAAQ